MQGGGAVLAGLTLLWSAGPLPALRLLFKPRAAWSAATAPVQISLSEDEADRGATIQVSCRPWVAVRHSLDPGTGRSVARTGIKLDSLGMATRDIGPLSPIFLPYQRR
jgi:hypothetical protein